MEQGPLQQSISFLQPIELRALLSDPSRADKILVLDVRDDDFQDGHINCKHFCHVPSYMLASEQRLDDFISQELNSADIDTVVVHCYLSQQRGPTAAQRLVNRLSQLERYGKPEVCVLAHGWRRWQQIFGHDQSLCKPLDTPGF